MSRVTTLSTARFSTYRVLLACLALGASLFFPSLVSAAEQLRILTWPGYADPDLVAQFERQSGLRVQVSYVNSDDELWDKINRNNGADYDVFAVNTAELQRYIDHGLTVPIDLRRIPNLANQLPRFRKREEIPGIVRSSQVYAIPYTYSEMGLIYNRKLVKQPPQSIAAMWDPAYRGRVLAHNTSNHNFSLAGMILGVQNPFRLKPEEFRTAAKKLVELRRNVRTFYGSPEDAVRLYLENDIALVFANYGTQQLKALQQAGADVGYVIPREGALAWLDCWAVTRGAKDRAKAERWINFTLEKAVSETLTARQGLANTITPPPESSQKDKLIWLEPLEDFAKRNALWSRILAGDSPEKF
jgi:putative spermidine/putrescine transport system substrate-binding protein